MNEYDRKALIIIQIIIIIMLPIVLLHIIL
jgi:hypothetical protein